MVWPMILGALGGLGLLAGNEQLRQRKKDEDERRRDAAYAGLLGEAPQFNMGPPTEAGEMGVGNPGRGLLADPTNARRQQQFAVGLMGVPGEREKGMNMLNAAAQRQQADDQFGRTEARLGGQFRETFGHTLDESERMAGQFRETFAAGRADAANATGQWQQSFNQAAAQAAEQKRQWEALFKERGQDRAADAASRLAAASTLQMPAGYTPYMSKSGPTLKPAEGTAPYAQAVGTEQSLTDAQARIGQMIDLVAGTERTVNGKKVRTGGQGSELYGDKAKQYSVLRGQIIADVAVLRNLGVINDKEGERLANELPDPSSFFDGTMSFNTSTVKAYETLGEMFRGKIKSHRRANPWLEPPLPPGFQEQP